MAKPPWDVQDHVKCGGLLAQAPVSTSLIQTSESGQCVQWFSIVDGFLRAQASLVTGVQIARLGAKCMTQRHAELAEGQGRRGGGGAAAGAFSTMAMGVSNRAGMHQPACCSKLLP